MSEFESGPGPAEETFQRPSEKIDRPQEGKLTPEQIGDANGRLLELMRSGASNEERSAEYEKLLASPDQQRAIEQFHELVVNHYGMPLDDVITRRINADPQNQGVSRRAISGIIIREMIDYFNAHYNVIGGQHVWDERARSLLANANYRTDLEMRFAATEFGEEALEMSGVSGPQS